MLNGFTEMSHEVEVILYDIRQLGRGFQCVNFSFIRRICNSVVHSLVGKGLIGTEYSLWTKSPPSWLLGG